MQGLENLGSTCAINSLVQIICRNHYLRNIILEYDLKKDGITDNLKELLVLMHEEKKSLRPRKFINNMFKILNGIFKYGEQIDIYELWIFLSQEIIKEINEDDRVIEVNGTKLVIDNKSLFYIQGVTLDFVDGPSGSGFVFNNPNNSHTCGCSH